MGLTQTLGRKLVWGCAPRRVWFCPSEPQPCGGGARRASVGFAPLLVEGLATTHASRRRGKVVRRATEQPIKMLKNEGRSGNVYENKGPCDNLPDTKDDISAWLHAILHRNARILWQPSTLFAQFGFWSLGWSAGGVWGVEGAGTDSARFLPCD